MKSFTDLEQSKKLAEILPVESADMCYPYDRNLNKMYGDIPYVMGYKRFNEDTDFPCWSLAALIDVLPDDAMVSFGKDEGWGVYWIDSKIASIPSTTYIGAMVKTIELLVKEGYIKGKEE